METQSDDMLLWQLDQKQLASKTSYTKYMKLSSIYVTMEMFKHFYSLGH